MVPATHAASRRMMNSNPSFDIKVTKGEEEAAMLGAGEESWKDDCCSRAEIWGYEELPGGWA